MKGKKLSSFVVVDDSTPIQKLSIMEQLRVLIHRLSNGDREQLKADDAETVFELRLKADLLEFLHKSTELVRNGTHHSVTVAVSSKFKPVLQDVLESPSITSYYNTSVVDPDIAYDIDYFLQVTLEVKSY